MGRWVRWFGQEEGETATAAPAARKGVRVPRAKAQDVMRAVRSGGEQAAITGVMSVEQLPAEMLTALLVEEGIVSPAEEHVYLQEHRATGRPVEEIISETGIVAESELMSTLSRRCKVPHLSLERYQIRPELIETVPAEFARANRIIPLEKLGKVLNVATSNPLDLGTFKKLQEVTGFRTRPVLATPRELRECLDKHYPPPEEEQVPEPPAEEVRVTAKQLFKDSWLGRIDEGAARADEGRGEAVEAAAVSPEETERRAEALWAVSLSAEEVRAFERASSGSLYKAWARGVGAGGGRGLAPLPLGDAEFSVIASSEKLERSRPAARSAQQSGRASKKRSQGRRKKKSGR